MTGRNHSRPVKVLAGLFGTLLLCIAILSACYLALEAGHHHDYSAQEEECPICACIQVCEHTLHRVMGGSTNLIAILMPMILLVLCTSAAASMLLHQTPVSEKIRMNN